MVNSENYKSFKKEIIDTLSIKNPIKYEFSNGINISFGRVIIRRSPDGSPIQYLDEFCNKDYMRKWKMEAGEILCKDIRRKKLDLYFELELSNHKVLLRSIQDDELEAFENNSAITNNIVKFGDVNFLIVKIIENESSYMAKEIIEEPYDYDKDDVVEEDTEESEEVELTSMSLFDENE